MHTQMFVCHFIAQQTLPTKDLLLTEKVAPSKLFSVTANPIEPRDEIQKAELLPGKMIPFTLLGSKRHGNYNSYYQL